MMRLPIHPAPRIFKVLIALALLALTAAFIPALEPYAWVAAVAAILISAWDISNARKLTAITIKRQLPTTLPVNAWTEVTLEIEHSSANEVELELFDHHPSGADVQFLPQRIMLKPGQNTRVRYKIRPEKRGLTLFGKTQLLMPSPLKLWTFSRIKGETSKVRVYPDFAAISHYRLLATDNRTSQLGIKRKPRRGEGLEFHQLRDYREGDSLRQIEWKASIRRQKLISKEYQDERDQQLFFMLDCGRRMRAQDDHLSHFDHALNAALLLSYVALRQGDAVGLMSFGGEQRWLAPQKTKGAINSILNSVYDLQPTTQASDYIAAAQTLIMHHRKRSLVVLITNLREESIEDLVPAVKLLSKHHLVLLASTREEILDTTLATPVIGFQNALAYLGAFDYLQERQQGQKQLKHLGILSIDVPPGKLPIGVVNSYWEIKRNRYL
jgi:uncharacterized protein (DUF58 family)